MSYPYYDAGKRETSVDGSEIEFVNMSFADDPKDYQCPESLSHAVNAALILGRPLLVTGEPGTGKTQLAYSVAYALNLMDEDGRPLVHKYETKSTSEARDLFYTYDSIRAFKTRESDEFNSLDFVEYEALGRAILEAFPYNAVKAFLTNSDPDAHNGPRRSVVLIDEVDKAPRDFPNDLLNFIERLYFRIPECGGIATPGADRGDRDAGVSSAHRPIVIMTSNSEKALPEPFLRRCVYHHISFPDESSLKKIVSSRVPDMANAAWLEDALQVFQALRGKNNGPRLRKAPSTAELIDWLRVLSQRLEKDQRLEDGEILAGTLPALVKTQDDLKPAQEGAGKALSSALQTSR